MIEFSMKKFKFSPSGNLLAITTSVTNDTIQIYDTSNDIQTFLSNKLAKQEYLSQLQNQELRDAIKICFYKNEDRVFIGTDYSVLLFQTKKGDFIKRFRIPQVFGKIFKNNLILDKLIDINASNVKDGHVLLKKADSNKICMVRLSKLRGVLKNLDSIYYTEQDTKELRGKVTSDLNCVFVNNQSDNILYEDRRQMQIPWFKSKNVLKMVEVPLTNKLSEIDELAQDMSAIAQGQATSQKSESKFGFICVTAKTFDNFITILHTHDPDFKIKFRREIVPMNYRFKDIIYQDGMIKILSVRDGELFLDEIKLVKHQSDNENRDLDSNNITNTSIVNSYNDAPYKSLQFMWPFIAYIHQSKEIVLLSANYPSKIFRFPFPFDLKTEIPVNLYLTEKLDLFYATLKSGQFFIYKLGDILDHISAKGAQLSDEDLSLQYLKWNHVPMIKYDMKTVENNSMFNLWVKSSNSKATNGKVMIQKSDRTKSDARFIMLHKNILITCLQGGPVQTVALVKLTKFVGPDNVYYEVLDPIKGESGQVKQINRMSIIFSNFRIERIYQENRHDFYIQGFTIDYTSNRTYVLLKQKKESTQEIFNFNIVIVDNKTLQVLIHIKLNEHQSNLIGPLKS